MRSPSAAVEHVEPAPAGARSAPLTDRRRGALPSASITNRAPSSADDADERLAPERLDVLDAALDRADETGVVAPGPTCLGPDAER